MMSKNYLRIAAMGLAAIGLLSLAACGGPTPEEAPPPPMATAPAPTQSPDLLGGPDQSAAAPADQPAAEADSGDQGEATMAPIPNPEDMTPAERQHFYGDRYAYMDQGPAAAAGPTAAPAGIATTAGRAVIMAGRIIGP